MSSWPKSAFSMPSGLKLVNPSLDSTLFGRSGLQIQHKIIKSGFLGLKKKHWVFAPKNNSKKIVWLEISRIKRKNSSTSIVLLALKSTLLRTSKRSWSKHRHAKTVQSSIQHSLLYKYLIVALLNLPSWCGFNASEKIAHQRGTSPPKNMFWTSLHGWGVHQKKSGIPTVLFPLIFSPSLLMGWMEWHCFWSRFHPFPSPLSEPFF